MSIKNVDYKYKQLYQILKKEIMANAVKGITKVPSENMLCRQYGLSNYTIRQAMSKLEQDGLIYRIQGKGCFVNEYLLSKKDRMIYLFGFDITPDESFFNTLVRMTCPPYLKKGYTFLSRVISTDGVVPNLFDMELKRIENISEIDCVLICSGNLDKIAVNKCLNLRCPVIFIGDFKSGEYPDLHFNQITGDNRYFAKLWMDYFIGKRYRRIVIFSGSLSYYFNSETVRAVTDIAETTGIELTVIEFPPGISSMSQEKREKVYQEKFAELKANCKRFDAGITICKSDPMLIEYIQELGEGSPEGIDIITSTVSQGITYSEVDYTPFYDCIYQRIDDLLRDPNDIRKIRMKIPLKIIT